jgi:hypothetical protein
MKLGPIHVVRDQTLVKMMNGTSATRVQLAYERDHLLALLAAEPSLQRKYRHSPLGATCPGCWLVNADKDEARSQAAARRVVAAYQKARSEYVAPRPSLWDKAEGRIGGFLQALNDGSTVSVQHHLSRMFQSWLVYGLGYLHPAVAVSICTDQPLDHFQILFTDMLVSLAEALGIARLTSMEQNLERHLHALDTEIEPLLHSVENVLGFPLSFPQVGAAYGCVVGDRCSSIDTVYHAYKVSRMRELGFRPQDQLAEIGGGYGCLAELCFRAGFRNYAIYDLLWVNALQGYFLIMALPDGAVRLFGENEGSVAVLPCWEFHHLPDQSIDHVVNTDSLPEMNRQTALDYLNTIRRVARGLFLSINQEAKVRVDDYCPQQCVSELAAEARGFRRISRQPHWMRQGYAEEVYCREGT